jgi:hypothetical protein
MLLLPWRSSIFQEIHHYPQTGQSIESDSRDSNYVCNAHTRRCQTYGAPGLFYVALWLFAGVYAVTFYTLYRSLTYIEVFETRYHTASRYLQELRAWNEVEPGRYAYVDRRCVKRVLGLPLTSARWPLPWPGKPSQ